VRYSPEAQAAICVLRSAEAAWPSAASAEPPLKLYQPAHTRAVPTKVSGRLCASCVALPVCLLFSIISDTTEIPQSTNPRHPKRIV
jgi:hypothetical protein